MRRIFIHLEDDIWHKACLNARKCGFEDVEAYLSFIVVHPVNSTWRLITNAKCKK